MADLLGSMRVEIVGDNSKLDKSIKDSDKKATGFSNTLKGMFTGIAVTVAVKKIAEVTTAFVKAASDAEETRNKYNVVFASVADEAKAAADRIKDEFKLSDETTENFLSGVGDITTGLGATSEQALEAAETITKLGLDINSFANLSGGAEQAVAALTSLFTGEREAAKALGIVINDTNLKQYAEDTGLIFKEMTPLEKGFLSLELAATQSELAIGDFARSEESFANQSKIAKESVKSLSIELGKILLPVATEGIGIFGDLTAKIQELVAAHNEFQEIVDRFDTQTDTLRDHEQIAQNQLKILRERITAVREEISEQGILSTKKTRQLVEERDALVEESVQLQYTIEFIRSKIKAEDDLAAAEEERNAAMIAAAQLELERLEIEEEVRGELGKLRDAELTDGEMQVKNLQNQIDHWVQFRDIPGTQELINELIEDRNELIEENTALLEDNIDTNKVALTDDQKAADERLSMLIKSENAIKERGLRIAAFEAEQATLKLEAEKERTAIEIELEEEKRAARQTTFDMIGSGLKAIDSLSTALASAELKRLEDSGASEEELDEKKKKLAKEAATRDRLLALFDITIATAAGIAKAIPNWPLVIAAGAVGTVQTAAVMATPVPSFAQGGIVAGNDFVGDNVPAFVNSGEMILNRNQQARLFELANSGGTTNNTSNNSVNINSMFSLGNDAKLNEAAERLFTPLQRVSTRRNASIGGI